MAGAVWFWQRMVSPHMAELAAALAARGRNVTYVAQAEMSAARKAQGWHVPPLGDARLLLAPTADAVRRLVDRVPDGSLHICQGLRGNGMISIAQRQLAARGLVQWAAVEAVDDGGWRGWFKRLAYRRLIENRRAYLQGVLAIGHTTSAWLAARGLAAEKAVPFAYFLPDRVPDTVADFDAGPKFRFLFVGRFVELKRLDLLVAALAALPDRAFELVVVGSGPLEEKLRKTAAEKLPGQVRWLGRRPMAEVQAHMARADCLVLPSRYDGWGAVVSEALMAGTPAICSDACGAAGVVLASNHGGVFPSGDAPGLGRLLAEAVAKGRQTSDERRRLAAWARCLGATAGAAYLDALLFPRTNVMPRAPWAPAGTCIEPA